MKNKKKPKSKARAKSSGPEKSNEILLCDFGSFGTLTKSNISELFVDIHASISPLDPIEKMNADALEKSY